MNWKLLLAAVVAAGAVSVFICTSLGLKIKTRTLEPPQIGFIHARNDRAGKPTARFHLENPNAFALKLHVIGPQIKTNGAYSRTLSGSYNQEFSLAAKAGTSISVPRPKTAHDWRLTVMFEKTPTASDKIYQRVRHTLAYLRIVRQRSGFAFRRVVSVEVPGTVAERPNRDEAKPAATEKSSYFFDDPELIRPAEPP